MSLPKNLVVIGAGHVGAPHAIMVAKKCPKVRVTIADDDERKVAAWKSSQLPFYEPGMQETLEEVRGINLFFASNIEHVIADADMILVSVSTPIKESGVGAGFAPDLQHWERIARLIARVSDTPKVIVERSTVPVKTASAMAAVLAHNSSVGPWVVLSNPEFARQGHAMMDHASPDREMIGGPETEAGRAAVEMLSAIYAQWVPPDRIIKSNLWSAELSKLTANAFLAQRVSSINAISALCERTGADVDEVSFAVGVDSRIGHKGMKASIGFGGACYETHLRNMIYLCHSYRLTPVATYWEHVLKMNEYQKKRFASKVVSEMFNTVSGKKLAVFGFTYKKNTSDTRFSPAIEVCSELLKERALLSIHDPRVAREAVSVVLKTDESNAKLVAVEADAYVAASGAHAILVLTEWDEFKDLDYVRIFASMQRPAFVFDGRNLLDHDRLREIGFKVIGIGKSEQVQSKEFQKTAAAAAAARLARVRVGAESPDPVRMVTGNESFGEMA